MTNINSRWVRYLSVLEIVPLMLFIIARTYDLDMPQRIFIGGVLSILAFALCVFLSIKFTPLYFGTNLFFILMSAILILPFPSLQTFFLDLREAGMFFAILIVGFVWLRLSPYGLLPPAQVPPDSKKYSWILFGIYAFCPVIAVHFKGDENLAGALPFVIIIVAEKVLSHFQYREMKKNFEYAK